MSMAADRQYVALSHQIAVLKEQETGDEERRDEKRDAASGNYSLVEMLFDVLTFVP